jgi:hypothetical protein
MSNQGEVEMSATTKPSVSAGQIPDLLKIGSIPTNVQMSVDTDVLDSVVHNSQFIRFTLQNKGILHSHSKIQFGFNVPTESSWLPLNIGVAGIIQRATLRIGNQTICEIDDFANFTAYRSLFMSGESMRERLQYTTGQAMGKKLAYNNEGDSWTSALPPLADSNALGGGSSLTSARGLECNMGRSTVSQPSQYVASTQDQEMPSYLDLYNNEATYTELSTFQWSLSDFFPFLKTNQLPLYMMKEQISLEFTLNPEIAGGRAWISGAGGAADTQTYSLNSAETKMFADYQYYPQEMMVAYANANRNLQFSYVDYRLSKLSFAGAEGSRQIRNVGGAGRIVSKIVYGWATKALTNKTSPLINWTAQALDRTAGLSTMPPANTASAAARAFTNNSMSVNVKMNNGFLYPIDVDNTARCFHNVVQAEGLTPYTTRQEYANEGNSLAQRDLEDININTALQGRQFWNATRLNRGERVNSRGIELYWTLNTIPAGNYDLRVYLETMKFATLKDGFVESYLA